MTSLAEGSTKVDRPLASDIDVYGLTHTGKVRTNNQDQFLIASLHKTMQVHASSVPLDQLGELTSESRGYLFIVADGVGGGPGGERASGTALQAIAEYATHTMRFYYHHDPDLETRFIEELQSAILESHEVIRARDAGAATTLTMVVVRWPRAYVVQVGDSRAYLLHEGRLQQLTKDQTMAQVLMDAGVVPSPELPITRWRNVLMSALGGREANPVLTTLTLLWEDVMLLCTDGLTKHVSDEEIEQQLSGDRSSEAICRTLLELALDRGGTDNITVVVGRLRARQPS
ncbi:MAG TPA: protein phosphatase 2C domain-containing protein [Gemmatimonadales bacterium]|nr:protein phosphatase 2C domain-containing protein [Gemmatimonadales bacterium]